MKFSYRRCLSSVCLILGLLLLLAVLPVWGEEAKPAILDFGRGLCPNCKQMEEILSKVKAGYGDQVDVRLLYVDKDEGLFKQYRIMLVPTQVFLDASGKEVFRHTGLFPLPLLEQKLAELKLIKDQGK